MKSIATSKSPRASASKNSLVSSCRCSVLIDGVDAGSRIGLADVAIEEVDLEVADSGLLQQTSGLLTRLVDVAAVTRQGFEFGLSEGILVARPREPAQQLRQRPD